MASRRTGTDSCNMTPIRSPSRPSKGQSLGARMQQEASKDRDQPPEHAQSSVPSRRSEKASLPIVSFKEGASKSIGRTTTGTSFLQRYDLRLCLQQKNKQVLSEWEAFTTLLRQLATLDGSIVLYPWKYMDHTSQPAIQLSPEPSNFFDISIYAPQHMSFEWMTGSTRHSLLFLGSSILPETLAKKLNPWLRATKQGLWPRQLPLVEQTICVGWLLFSAPEYNLEELHRTILMATGVEVALRYRTISDKLQEHAPHQLPRVKAIHIEVDSMEPRNF